MTPLHLVLGEHGPSLLLVAIALAAVLTLLAAAFEIALERAGGPDPAALPDWLAQRAPLLFLLGGVPAVGLAMMIAAGLALALGDNPERSSLPVLWPLLLDLSVLFAVVCCGLGSPPAQHWGLGVTTFGAGVGSLFPLLFVINALPFGEEGGLPFPERFVFALAVGLTMLSVVLAAAALLALVVTSVRAYRSLRDRPRAAVPGRLSSLERRRS